MPNFEFSFFFVLFIITKSEDEMGKKRVGEDGRLEQMLSSWYEGDSVNSQPSHFGPGLEFGLKTTSLSGLLSKWTFINWALSISDFRSLRFKKLALKSQCHR